MVYRKRKKKRQPIKKKNYIYILTIVFGFLILLINDFGLVKLIKLQRQKNKLEKDLTALYSQQTSLRETIYRLQFDSTYINKIAREKYMMVLPGEKVYRVLDEKSLKQQ